MAERQTLNSESQARKVSKVLGPNGDTTNRRVMNKEAKVTFQESEHVVEAQMARRIQKPTAVVQAAKDMTNKTSSKSGHVVNDAKVEEKRFRCEKAVMENTIGKLDVSEIIELKDGGTKLKEDAKVRAENVIGKSFGGKRKREDEEREEERKSETEEKDQQSWLIKTLTEIIKTLAPKMLNRKYKFVNVWELAKFNERWLKHYRWDLELAQDR